MPNLARLVESGVMGNLATLQPVLSPMLWTSIATGKRAYKHGIQGFSEPDPVTGGIRPVTNLSRKTKAIWNILNQEGKNTITVGWWPSNPAEPLSKGVMVSNDYQRAPGSDPDKWPMKKGTIHPGRLASQLKDLRFHPAELDENDLRPFLPGLEGLSREELDKAAKNPRMQSLMKIIADCTSIHSAATALMQNEPWDLMAVYYDAIDHFGHGFMKFHPPQRKDVSDEDFRLFHYITEAGYRFHDMMLGTLMHLAGEDTTIILMSDHGFHPDDFRLTGIPREPAGPAAEHRQFGIFAASGPGLKKDARVYGANLLDICPTLLHLFGLPVGADMDGKVLTDIYQTPPTEIAQVPSWDELEGDHGMHPPDRQISAEDSHAALKQLVALGYIEEPGEDLAVAMERTVREQEYNLAQAYLDGGIFTEAIGILRRLYRRWPMEHRFGFKLATCYQSLNRPDELRAVVDTVIENRLQEAREATDEIKARKLNEPESRKAEQVRIQGLPAAQRDTEARALRDLFGKSRPNLFSMRYLQACADIAEHRYENALEKLAQLDSDYGARSAALTLKGEAHQRLRQWPESKKAFHEALSIDSETPGPLLGLARTAMAERQFEEAIDHARASLGLLFFQPKAHYLLGLAHYRLGQMNEAEQAYLQCARQAPLFAAAYRMLAQLAQYHQRDPGKTLHYKEQVKVARQKQRELRESKQRERETLRHNLDEQIPLPEFTTNQDSLTDIPEEEIITVVSGLPRSGTSLMMQILEGAGIPPFTDGKRTADDSNRKGYYEHEKVASLMKQKVDRSWIAEAKGKAIKIVAPLLVGLPKGFYYRVLFMDREMEEILASQTAMLSRLNKTPPSGQVARAYRQQVRHALHQINRSQIPALKVSFRELVHESDNALTPILNFVNRPEARKQIMDLIDPQMHRERRMPAESDNPSS